MSRFLTLKSVILVGILIVMGVVVFRTIKQNPKTNNKGKCKSEDPDYIQADTYRVSRFQRALRIPTITRSIENIETEELYKLQQHIIKSFPVIHSSPIVQLEIVANLSMLYQVRGSDASLTPYLLMSHMDVVPVDDGDEWDAPPFSGEILDGYIYGRGAIDTKHTLFGILEALEYALKNGHKPKRSLYIAFGHDEEVRGTKGAKNIANILRNRGLRFQFVIDEGTTILKHVMKGVEPAVAMISCSEKGMAFVRLSVNMTGGHSSMPEKESAIGVLAAAVQRLENSPQPSMLGTGPEQGLLEELSEEMPFYLRMFMKNIWLFKPILDIVLSSKPTTNALIRTTTAVTEFHAGVKENVIAPSAWATLNHRVHPSQSIQEVLDHDRAVINDERVKVELVFFHDAHPVSPYDAHAYGYQTIKASIEQVWAGEDLVVVPGLMVGNTDTRYYLDLSDQIYRFGPAFMYPEDVKRFHGKNERISVKHYEKVINFFYHLMLNADEESLPTPHSHHGEL